MSFLGIPTPRELNERNEKLNRLEESLKKRERELSIREKTAKDKESNLNKKENGLRIREDELSEKECHFVHRQEKLNTEAIKIDHAQKIYPIAAESMPSFHQNDSAVEKRLYRYSPLPSQNLPRNCLRRKHFRPPWNMILQMILDSMQRCQIKIK